MFLSTFFRKIRSNKWLMIIFVIVFLVLGFYLYNFISKRNKPQFSLEKITRHDVIQEVSETGIIKVSDRIDISFKTAGRIEKIYVKEGDRTEKSQELAKLDSVQLGIQASQARASLDIVKADYDKLLAGTVIEDVKVSESAVLNAKIAFDSSRQSLVDIQAQSGQSLKEDYENALGTLDDSYLKIYNANNVVEDIYRTYFTKGDQEGSAVRENRDKINSAVVLVKSEITKAKNSLSQEDIDNAISKTKDALYVIKNSLTIIRENTETLTYRDIVSSANKTSLDNQKSYINTAYSNAISLQQEIATMKITNDKNINAAKAEVSLNEARLQKAEDELALKKAGPQKETIDLYQAKIKQAEAQVWLLQNQVQDSVLRSPLAGQVTEINKREGETAQAGESVISFLPQGPFQIKADIYEEDIVKIKVGNAVDISVAAFGDKIIKGEVVSINPAEKIINEIVYYEITISVNNPLDGIKPGMTADIIIKTDRKDNVLAISKGIIEKREGKYFVKVFHNGKTEEREIQEREIQTGLVGDEFIEIISGLKEGDQVIIKTNNG